MVATVGIAVTVAAVGMAVMVAAVGTVVAAVGTAVAVGIAAVAVVDRMAHDRPSSVRPPPGFAFSTHNTASLVSCT